MQTPLAGPGHSVHVASTRSGLVEIYEFEDLRILVQYGDYAPILELVVENLILAREHSANENQRQMIDSYVAHFQSGDVEVSLPAPHFFSPFPACCVRFLPPPPSFSFAFSFCQSSPRLLKKERNVTPLQPAAEAQRVPNALDQGRVPRRGDQHWLHRELQGPGGCSRRVRGLLRSISFSSFSFFLLSVSFLPLCSPNPLSFSIWRRASSRW